MANFATDVPNTTLAKLVDAIANSIRQPNGSILTSFTDRLGTAISAAVPAEHSLAGNGKEFILEVRINPDGLTATAKVKALSPMGTQAIEGAIDSTVLATKLV